MSYHKNSRVDNAFIQLMDALVSWERDTGRGSRLFFIPKHSDDTEKPIFLMDGKPFNVTPSIMERQLRIALEEMKK